MNYLSEYRKQKTSRDKDKFYSVLIVAVSVILIFAIIILAAVETKLDSRNEVIYENLKSCPASSVVDYRQGEPVVFYKGRKVNIATEGCK
jgi:hypothetical protein